ncbi:hypothetical protein TUM4433_28210 [Shewanella schlegeliana]|nr:hypothetical protein TUM4433_28210 [Shewanella schlegeliana]
MEAFKRKAMKKDVLTLYSNVSLSYFQFSRCLEVTVCVFGADMDTFRHIASFAIISGRNTVKKQKSLQ